MNRIEVVKGDITKIAVSTVKEFLAETSGLEKVIFVCFDDEGEELIKNELTLFRTIE